MNNTNFKNHFLVAMPALSDSIFERSVIFLCEHNEDGAMGIIINKPLNVTLGSVLEHLDIDDTPDNIAETPVYMGGPVGQEHGFVIHTPYKEDESDEDLIISASRETLADIADDNGPEHYMVTLGYAGWDAGQLEVEINRNDWLLVEYEPHIIFETPLELRWKQSIELLGININQLSDSVGHA